MKLTPRAAALYDKYDKPWFANEVARLEKEVEEWEASFDLYHAASMRGIKMWQEATGKDMVWPDQGELTAWLIEKLDKILEHITDNGKLTWYHFETWANQIETRQRYPSILTKWLFSISQIMKTLEEENNENN
ncbi:MAG: hypothetical protein ACYTDW_18765 [Planctomycetota bacterium]|jgi:hypothetical protein